MQGGAKKSSRRKSTSRRKMSWYTKSSSANLKRLERLGRMAERQAIIEETMMRAARKNSKAKRSAKRSSTRSLYARSSLANLKRLEQQGRMAERQAIIEQILSRAYAK